jgi:hypothetical protein
MKNILDIKSVAAKQKILLAVFSAPLAIIEFYGIRLSICIII